MQGRIILLSSLLLTHCTSPRPSSRIGTEPPPAIPSLSLESSLLETSRLSWQPRADHVAMVIPAEPLQKLKLELEHKEAMTLQSRPEASLWVLSPAELKILRAHMSLGEIHSYISKVGLQKIPFQPVCLSILRREEADKTLVTYFLALESKGLLEVRRQLSRHFVEHGGKPGSFDPEAYRPRITVGFNDRDLLREDSATGSSQPCVYHLAQTNLQPTEDARPTSKPLR